LPTGSCRNGWKVWEDFALLAKESLNSLFHAEVTWRDFIYQLYFIGVKSQSVVLITGAFHRHGPCCADVFQFHKVKMDTATLAVVSVSMCSELGPVLTALMVAGALAPPWLPNSAP